MTVNGLQLPEAFAALIDRPQPIVWWVPKGGSDRWVFRGGEGGVYWAPEGTPDRHDYLDGLELIRNLETVVEKTNLLPSEFSVDYYTPEEIAEQNAANALLPGSIPFITDFSKIVQFGYAGDGAAYCFDFRENPDEPSIVHWNDGYWRRVAPNFQYFIDLFEPLDRDKALLESVRTTNTAELRDWLRFVDEKIASGQLQESTQADFERQSHLIRQELHRRAGEER